MENVAQLLRNPAVVAIFLKIVEYLNYLILLVVQCEHTFIDNPARGLTLPFSSAVLPRVPPPSSLSVVLMCVYYSKQAMKCSKTF